MWSFLARRAALRQPKCRTRRSSMLVLGPRQTSTSTKTRCGSSVKFRHTILWGRDCSSWFDLASISWVNLSSQRCCAPSTLSVLYSRCLAYFIVGPGWQSLPCSINILVRFIQAVALLHEMKEIGLPPYPAAHQAAISAVAAVDGHKAAIHLLARMKVCLTVQGLEVSSGD